MTVIEEEKMIALEQEEKRRRLTLDEKSQLAVLQHKWSHEKVGEDCD